MSNPQERFNTFSKYAASLEGDEKGEAQVFLDRLFQAFGHQGYKEAGATLEHRVRVGKGTKFADLFWEDRVLIEMKKRGTNLQKHYKQAFNYWVNLTPNRPKYVVLCNFDEFYIYDFDLQVNEPVDTLKTNNITARHTALNFLSIEKHTPIFKNNLIDVTKEAAYKAAKVYNSLVRRGENPKICQRFILQCIFCMFAEDYNLLPSGLFTELLTECQKNDNCYEMLWSLFSQMDNEKPARGGKFIKVPYFNGGLFATVDPIEMNKDEVTLLIEAATEDWSKVKPEIFGTLFQSSMGKEERHAYGAHFTSEADIYKIVMPTIINPWEVRVANTKTLKGLEALLREISKFTVLDPACGSGNFLYIAYRELKKIEAEIIEKIYNNFSAKALSKKTLMQRVGTKQFFGIDNNSFAVELAKVTLILAKEISVINQTSSFKNKFVQLPDMFEKTLPLDNIDDNIICEDALFIEWPKSSTIIGNPPYQSKNKMQQEFSPAYMDRLRTKYQHINGRADYCVYWFRKAHDHLNEGQRAGLVGTNTIRQTYSRESGLDYIVDNGGTITDAVSSQVWSGDAIVHVSIVNWIKGQDNSVKQLKIQKGNKRNSPWEHYELDFINSSLSPDIDVSKAQNLAANSNTKTCFQGQTHGNDGFLLSKEAAFSILKKDANYSKLIYPFAIGDDLLSRIPPQPSRYVIDFSNKDLDEASQYASAFNKIKTDVLPEREEEAEKEKERNNIALKNNPKARVNWHHRNFLNKWWRMSYERGELIDKLSSLSRYIVCSRVTMRPIFFFLCSSIHPNDSLQVFTFEDDYSFGILQSSFHWCWFSHKCSTMKSDPRYTSSTVYDQFPWPQKPSMTQIKDIAASSQTLRKLRNEICSRYEISVRKMYANMELPGKNKLREAHAHLDEAVCKAYGFDKKKNTLRQLLELNLRLHKAEKEGNFIQSPGVPNHLKNTSIIISKDCISI